MTSSYQRLKRRLAYGKQREKELEEMLHAVDRELKKLGIVISVPLLSKGIAGDDFLTDINTGNAQFSFTNIQGWFL